MKYFHVRFIDSTVKEFIVKAENNDEATKAVEDFYVNEKHNSNVKPLRTDTNTGIDTSETDVGTWNAAVKKNKGTK